MVRRRQRVRAKRGPMINSALSRTIRPSGAIHPSKHRGVYHRVALRADPLTAPQHEVWPRHRAGNAPAGCIPFDPEYDRSKGLAARGLQCPSTQTRLTTQRWRCSTSHSMTATGPGRASTGMSSMVFTPEGLERAKELFETMFKK